MTSRGYNITIERLSEKLGGGFVGYAAALMGCVADGDSEAEALTNLGDAIDCWLAAARANHRPIPQRDLELLTT
jgi:predicted RNase H-like HicB family nuclease